MRLRCGGIFNDHCIANFLESVWVKNFERRSIFDKVMTKTENSVAYLCDSRCSFAIAVAFNKDYKKAQLSLKNPRDACEKFARFTSEQWGCKLYS